TRAKAASADVTLDSPEASPIAFNIDKHYYTAVKIEDIASVQSKHELRSIFRGAHAEAVPRHIDTDVLGLYGSAGNTVSGGSAVDDADILQVVAYFDTNKAPGSQRHGIIGANTKNDLLNVNKYVAYDQTGKTGKAVDGSDGMVTEIYNMSLHMS